MADRTRAGYDAVARPYTDRFRDELADKPFDREILNDFAKRLGGDGVAIDLGCGPGQVAAYLVARGLSTMGVDVSSGMATCAKQLHPSLTFLVGDMRDLPFGDQSVAGIAAFYSILHISRDQVPAVVDELYRVLRPGGLLLVAFHLGDRVEHVDEFLGKTVSLDFVMFLRQEMEDFLVGQDFDLLASHERGPYPDIEAQTERAYLLARRPA